MGGNAREQGRSTTSRVLALLGAFTPMRTALSLTDLARAAGLPTATAHRLAGELVAWGALERLPDGTYEIGLRLWRLGALAPGARDLPAVARRFLGDLHEATGQTVHLVVPDGPGTRIIDTLGGPGPAGRTAAAGQVLRAFARPATAPDDLAPVRQAHLAYVGDEVAAPVFGRDGSLVAAIAVVGDAGTDLPALAMAVRTTALGITRTLTAGA
jgi:DNA-binding IclR family transcriptional regulator